MKPVDIRNETWADIAARVDGDRRAVYDGLTRHGPATTRALAAAMGWDPFNVRPRVTELCQIGLARLAGRRRREGVYMTVPLAVARAEFERAKAGGAEQMLLRI
jgi:hypothetical protein